ncbi:MAG: hypothetical protein GY940_26860 [bacterium]|nr:hypothetical protein [bacterium]
MINNGNNGDRQMKIKISLLSFIIVFSFMSVGCGSPEPEPFVLHEDECYYCKMRLNDLRFAAQLIETGNLHRKFCSIECLFANIRERRPEMLKAYVNDYLGSGLIEAANASYLMSPNIPSPMGLNLSAFRTPAKRDGLLKEKQGKPFTYDGLLAVDVPSEFRTLREKRMKEIHGEEGTTKDRKEK